MRQHARAAWRTFFFRPVHYWKSALVVFALILIIMLCVDGWLFWRLVYSPQYITDDAVSERFMLNRKELDSALRLLRERELRLLQTDKGSPPREIFGVPTIPISTE